MEKTILIPIVSMLMLFTTPINFDSLSRDEMMTAKKSSVKWKKVKESENIMIYERWIKVENNRMVRQLKASMKVKSSTSEIISVIKNDQIAIKWQSGVKSFYHLQKNNNECWFSYTLYAIPWPLSNQDVVTKYQVVQFSNSNKIKIKMTGVPDYIPENKGISRIKHYCGSWVLTPLTNGFCKVDYYVYSKQKSSFPKWATDPIVRNNLWNTFNNLRNVINDNYLTMID